MGPPPSSLEVVLDAVPAAGLATRMTAHPDRSSIQAEILRQTSLCGAGKTICPSEVARALAPEAWRPLLGPVRKAAVALAREGRLDVLRKGRPADLDDLRGVIRLRTPGAQN
jgi:hypothetical protein